MADQLSLFPSGIDLERRFEQLRNVAAALPAGLRLGTSSWTFPGWAGLVYPRKSTTAELARDGLRDYARHPLFRTVGIDRGYYAPIPDADLLTYDEQLPPGFPCCVKAPAAVTSLTLPQSDRRNPDFLSAERFSSEMLEPFERLFRTHTGPFIIQLSPHSREAEISPARFLELLDDLLANLPQHFRYAVELRERGLLIPAYGEILARHGAAHVYSSWTAMPRPGAQARTIPPESFPFTVIRLLLRPGRTYQQGRDKFAPFDRLVEPDPALRKDVETMVRDSLARGRETFVLVNNKAEGSAPLTVEEIARALAGSP
jgi:uncharacterized protein YecE (DUF72 family)